MKKAISQLKLSNVRINSGFWKKRMDVNRLKTLPIEYEQCRKTGRINALKLKWKEGKPNKPHIFWDSDIAKWIEAAAYSLSQFHDPELERKVDNVVNLIEKAQLPDGYFNSHFQSCGIQGRWKNLRDNHELYCAGHLIEAAVAYHQATQKKALLSIVCRFADHIDSTFGIEKSKIPGYCGHEEIELALIKLYRETKNKKYLNLAK